MILSNPDQVLVRLAEVVEQALAAHPVLATLVGMLLSSVPLVLVFAACFAIATWLERKGLARVQNRIGPNRTGPFGLLQPAADGVKMLTKEDIVPRSADRFAHFFAPVLVVIPAMMVLAFVPVGRNMTAAPIESAVVMFFGLGAIGSISVFLAGWSSRNKYSLVGAMRSIAQMVSYEIPLVMAAIVPVMMTGTLNTAKIVTQQQELQWITSDNMGLQFLGQIVGWNVFTPWGFVGFLLFFVASIAEVNRSPFDLPEADSEIIAGHLTEYSGFKYALFFLAEYICLFAISGLAVTLFLGGWSGPNIRPPWSDDPHALLIPGFVWFFLKIFLLLAAMIWVRGTMPRLRVDQLMAFAWKFLLPLNLVNIFACGLSFHLERQLGHFAGTLAGWLAAVLVLGTAYSMLGRITRRNVQPRRTYQYAS